MKGEGEKERGERKERRKKVRGEQDREGGMRSCD